MSSEQSPRFDFELKAYPKPAGNNRPRVEIDITVPVDRNPNNPFLEGLELVLPLSKLDQGGESVCGLKGLRRRFAEYRLWKLSRKGIIPEYQQPLPDPVYTTTKKDEPEAGDVYTCDPIYYHMLNKEGEQRRESHPFLQRKHRGRIGAIAAAMSVFLSICLVHLMSRLYAPHPAFVLLVIMPLVFWAIPTLVYKAIVVRYICFPILSPGYIERDLHVKKVFYLPWRPGEMPDYSDYMGIFNMLPIIIEWQLQNGLDSGQYDGDRVVYGQASQESE